MRALRIIAIIVIVATGLVLSKTEVAAAGVPTTVMLTIVNPVCSIN
ncbi:MAG: hypothetical protein FWG64_07015 [Firmicutes bacterium]|nr:hypothetical protein [Bacillota bacterium]